MVELARLKSEIELAERHILELRARHKHVAWAAAEAGEIRIQYVVEPKCG